MELYERNKKITQLRKLGYSTYMIGKVLKMENANVWKICKRDLVDKDKYPDPTPEEAKALLAKYPKPIKNPYLK